MVESITAAQTVVRSRARSLGIAADFHEKHDVHIHMPEGATPKDGPSAGIGMCTALVSALTQIPVRADVAMTGEITLRGQVLAIGGLKEKLLAAHRGGIKTVIIPEENVRDLKEIPKISNRICRSNRSNGLTKSCKLRCNTPRSPCQMWLRRLSRKMTNATAMLRKESARISSFWLGAFLDSFSTPCYKAARYCQTASWFRFHQLSLHT